MDSFIGKTCPYCQVVIKPGAELTICPVCQIPHHSECWACNGFKCTTFGCDGAKEVSSFRGQVSDPQPPDGITVNCEKCGTKNLLDPSRPAYTATCGRCGSMLNPPHTAIMSENICNLKPLWAGFWLRLLASVIDFMALLPVNLLLEYAVRDASTQLMLGIFVAAIYSVVFESSAWQATIGKRVLGIIVTDEQGSRIDAGKALGRHLGKFVSGLPLGLGFIMVGFTDRKQGLHDKIAGTLVLKREL